MNTALSAVATRLSELGIEYRVVEARIKDKSEYTWLTYIGTRAKNLIHGNKTTSVTIEPHDVIGLRPSSDGKKYRLVTKKTGLTKVFSIPETLYKQLFIKSKPAKAPRIQYSVAKQWVHDVTEQMEKKGTKGALHRYFGIDESETIPVGLLKEALRDPKTSEKTRKHPIRIEYAKDQRRQEMKPEPICDPSNPRYVLGNQGGYSITLKSNNHVLWTRTGVRCRSNAVYVDLVTRAVYEATGPHALKKTHFEVVVRDGQHSDEELAPIVEPLIWGEQYGDVVTMQDGRVFKSQSCIKGRQAIVMGPNNKAYLGNGLLFGKPIELTPISNSVTASTYKEVTAMAKKPAKKETPKHPEIPGLETASANLIKLKRTVSSEPEFFKYFSKASGIYMDAISGAVPSFEDVSEALMDVNTELKQVKDESVAKHGKTFFEAFRDFRNSYKEWLMSNTATASDKYELPEADLKLLKKIAKAIKYDWKPLASRPENAKKMLDEYRKNGTVNGHKVQAFTSVASDKVWVAASPKGGNVTDVSALKALEKYIEVFGKRGKLKLHEAVRSNGMVSFTSGCQMFKGTLPEIIAELKEKAIATAKSKAKARASTETAKPVVVIAEETYGNKVAGQIYGDVKSIAAKLKSWKKSMSKEEYAQYEAYQKGIIKYVLSNVLSKLPEEYQTKIKAI